MVGRSDNLMDSVPYPSDYAHGQDKKAARRLTGAAFGAILLAVSTPLVLAVPRASTGCGALHLSMRFDYAAHSSTAGSA